MAEGVTCLSLNGSRSVCTCQHHVPWDPWNVVLTLQAPTLLFLTVLYNIRELLYSVIVGRSLDGLKTNLNPLWPVLFPRFYRPSNNDRTVWVRGQFDSIRKVWCLGCRVKIMRRWYLTAKEEISKWWTGQILAARKCPDCDSQKVQHQAPSTEQLLYSRLVPPS